MALLDAPREQTLCLIIRFTASIPDLPLTITSPATTTALSLKAQIRSHLPSTHASNRLRLIHAGKVLADAAPLTASLNVLPPPPPPLQRGNAHPWQQSTTSSGEHDGAVTSGPGKGKGPAGGDRVAQDPIRPPLRIYIHCSIGDALSRTALDAEARAAQTAEAAAVAAALRSGEESALKGRGPPSSSDPNSQNPIRINSSSPSSSSTSTESHLPPSFRRSSGVTTDPAPQGFDRLLNAGFTPAEVATLRSQFLGVLSHTHTPDTLPSGPALRRLEDGWLDNEAPGSGSGGGTGEAGTADGAGGWGNAGFGSDNAGGLEDMLIGNVIGFFWPLGAAMVWGCREEGVWTRRRQIAVATGLLVNLTFGFLRLTS